MINVMNKLMKSLSYYYNISRQSHCLLTRNWIFSFVFSIIPIGLYLNVKILKYQTA